MYFQYSGRGKKRIILGDDDIYLAPRRMSKLGTSYIHSPVEFSYLFSGFGETKYIIIMSWVG